METKNQQELIICLIRDSLINIKLTSGLNALGLNADDYHLYLGDTIFSLMDLDANEHCDVIYESVYLANAQKVKHINFSFSTEELDALSKEIYHELIFAKEIYGIKKEEL
jgi:hypothetical protein